MLTIDGAALKRFIINGANKLAANREKVDSMNVFPVPDGDTGTNMSYDNYGCCKGSSKSLIQITYAMEDVCKGSI